MEMIDRFYYSNENVDRLTVSRFYGYTLEDTGPGALRQLAPYLEYGHMLSADRTVDYSAMLGEITTPTLLVAGDGDIMSDVPSTELTFAGLGSPDKTMMRFGKSNGHVADYGHCDLVWSRHAPREIFPPIIDWLDQRQPGVGPSAPKPSVRLRGRHDLSQSSELSRCRSATRFQIRAGSRRRSTAGRNSGLGQPFFPRRHVRLLELEEMDHAQVDLSDRGRVIVDQADPTRPAGAGDLDFLVELAPHRRLVGIEALSSLGVFFRHVPADAQRSQPVQPGLALRFASRVAEDGVATAEDDVGDDLLEAGVVFDLRPGPVLHQLGDEQGRDVTLGFGRETLKPAETVKLGAGNDQDTFVDFLAHHRPRGDLVPNSGEPS